MLSTLYQHYIFTWKPKVLGWITKLLYTSKNIKIKKGLLCDSIPKIIVSKNSSLFINKNVYLRSNIEIRAHKISNIEIGENVKIDRGVRLLSTNKSKLLIGPKTAIGLYSVFNGGDNIIIGKSCLISGFVYLQTSMHTHKKGKLIKEQGFTHAPINIEDDVWLGAHTTILPGCKLGYGAIIGSNAVVTKSIKSNEIVAGIPAKKINFRN